MKQLETSNQKIIKNVINFYEEIGIDITISHKQTHKSKKFNEKNYTSKNKEKNIKELEQSFKNFEQCSLKKTCTNFVNFLGNINSKLLIIDGPPDAEEDKKGISFVSDKGLLFKKMLNAIELNFDDVFIVKSIPWRPPGNRYPSTEEIKICRPFIFNLINLMKPKIVVCLGEVPTNQIFETNESIIKVRGKWQLLKSEDLNFEFFILPTFSISHLIIRPDLKKFAWEDMKLLRDKIKEIL